MPKVERNGDMNTGGGIAQMGATTVFVNGKQIMLPGQPVTSHGESPHDNPRTQGGSSTVFADNQKVIHENDIDTCGHKRSSPSPDVFVGS